MPEVWLVGSKAHTSAFPIEFTSCKSVIFKRICPTNTVYSSWNSLCNHKSGKLSRGVSSNPGKAKGQREGGVKGGAAMVLIPLCLRKVLRRKWFISLMEMWVAGRGQKKSPGVRNNCYIGRGSPLECNGIIKIYL